MSRYYSKKMKTLIFMINLAIADLAHVLSLPLRIYYYFTLTWPFGRVACLLCFSLKYLNMYAAIVFLVSSPSEFRPNNIKHHCDDMVGGKSYRSSTEFQTKFNRKLVIRLNGKNMKCPKYNPIVLYY
jgi:hypothetical protein